MEFDNNLPIYLQIVNIIKGKIVAGELEIDEKLPSVRDLSKEFMVNPNTVQRSYQELEREGLVVKKRGLGSFVTDDSEKISDIRDRLASDIVEDFIEKMSSLGYKDKDIKKNLSRRLESDN